MADHGFEAGVEAAYQIEGRGLDEALRASDQARLGDRQELVERIARLHFEDEWDTADEAWKEEHRGLASDMLNVVADWIEMEGLRDG